MLWLDRDPERRTEIASFSGRTDAIARYLLEQVARDLEPSLRDFMLETSILETFDADLADAVRGRSDSRQALTRLRAFDALLISLDPAQQWFRYHQLFAEFLTEELMLRDIDRMRVLHQRASTLFAAQGHIQRATQHACRAGDVARAVAIIEAAGVWELVLQRGIGFARGLLSLFHDDRIASNPVLLRIRCYLHMKFGALEDARRCTSQAASLSHDAVGQRDHGTERAGRRHRHRADRRRGHEGRITTPHNSGHLAKGSPRRRANDQMCELSCPLDPAVR